MSKDKQIPLPQALEGREFLPRDGAPRSYKAKGLANILPNLTRKIAGKRPTLVSELQEKWPELVGAQMAGMTRPLRLHQGVLTVEMAQGSGPLVAMAQDQMLARINLAEGQGKIQRIRLTQGPR